MSSNVFVILYAADPAASALFYTRLLGRPPVEASPTFVLFALDGGAMLGLWGRDGVRPPATAPGGSEVAFAVEGVAAVRERHARWRSLDVAVIQEPVQMDFGFTFTAADPDGHRLRVFAPGAAQAER